MNCRRPFCGQELCCQNCSRRPSAMPFMPSAFARLLEPLDRRVIARAVAAHDGDHGVGRGDKAWTCERHLKALLFAQLAGLTSLRADRRGAGRRRARRFITSICVRRAARPCRTPMRRGLRRCSAISRWRWCRWRRGRCGRGRGVDPVARRLAHAAQGPAFCLGRAERPHPRVEAASAV